MMTENIQTLSLFVKKHLISNKISLNKMIRICFLIDLTLKEENSYNLFSKKYILHNGYPTMSERVLENVFKNFLIKDNMIEKINQNYQKDNLKLDNKVYNLIESFYFLNIKNINNQIREKLNQLKIIGRNIYLTECNKKPFPKELASLLITKKIIFGTRLNKKNEIRYYYCDYCDSYHLTSQPKYVKKEKK